MREQGAGRPRTHLGHAIAVESDQQEADTVEQVLVADVVVRLRRGHGGVAGMETAGSKGLWNRRGRI